MMPSLQMQSPSLRVCAVTDGRRIEAPTAEQVTIPNTDCNRMIHCNTTARRSWNIIMKEVIKAKYSSLVNTSDLIIARAIIKTSTTYERDC